MFATIRVLFTILFIHTLFRCSFLCSMKFIVPVEHRFRNGKWQNDRWCAICVHFLWLLLLLLLLPLSHNSFGCFCTVCCYCVATVSMTNTATANRTDRDEVTTFASAFNYLFMKFIADLCWMKHGREQKKKKFVEHCIQHSSRLAFDKIISFYYCSLWCRCASLVSAMIVMQSREPMNRRNQFQFSQSQKWNSIETSRCSSPFSVLISLFLWGSVCFVVYSRIFFAFFAIS